MNNIEVLEELSDNEHSRWANWQKYVHSKCIKNKDGSLTIPKEYVDHWNYEINTEYKDLPENIKESDRKEARKILETLNYKNLIKENKELKEKLEEKDMQHELELIGKEEYTKDAMGEIIEHYYTANEDCISKSKIKEKIEELDKRKRKSQIEYSTIDELIFDKKIEALQELLEEGE